MSRMAFGSKAILRPQLRVLPGGDTHARVREEIAEMFGIYVPPGGERSSVRDRFEAQEREYQSAADCFGRGISGRRTREQGMGVAGRAPRSGVGQGTSRG
jgi:hypothetical protein